MWRVACVRIPRFPIGATWQARRAEHPDATASRLTHPSTPPATQLALPLLLPPRPSGAGGGAPSRRTDAPDDSLVAHWDDAALALADGDAGPGRRLRAVSGAAARQGARIGMTVAAARAACAALVVWPWDDACITDAVTATTAAFLVASPQVTPAADAPGTWWIGAGGLDGVGGEAQLAHALVRLAAHWHPAPRIGIADSCVAARAATWDARARAVEPVVVVPHGGCAAYLAGVPLALVPMDDEVRAGLAALGMRVAGGLAALDPGDVERRWGAAGLAAWRLARGEDTRRPVLARAEATRAASAELPVPARTLEPVLFLVRSAIDRLAHELARDAVGAAIVALTLALEGGRTITREVRLPRPVARAGPLFERCRALLERVTLPAPVLGLTVAITATGRLGGDQGDLLTGAWRDPAAAEAAFARIRAELGPNVVVRPERRDTHRPERAGAWRPVEIAEAPPNGAVPNDSDDAPLPASLRLLDPPEPARVTRDDTGAPTHVEWRGTSLDVAHAVGPERLAGEWWQDTYRRDYWRCLTEAGELLLYLDAVCDPPVWRVQGWFD